MKDKSYNLTFCGFACRSDMHTACRTGRNSEERTLSLRESNGHKDMRFINVGFGNMIAVNRILALVSPDSAPVKRMISDSKELGRVVDVTCGKRTKAVIVTDSEYVVLSAFSPESISNRIDAADGAVENASEELEDDAGEEE